MVTYYQLAADLSEIQLQNMDMFFYENMSKYVICKMTWEITVQTY